MGVSPIIPRSWWDNSRPIIEYPTTRINVNGGIPNARSRIDNTSPSVVPFTNENNPMLAGESIDMPAHSTQVGAWNWRTWQAKNESRTSMITAIAFINGDPANVFPTASLYYRFDLYLYTNRARNETLHVMRKWLPVNGVSARNRNMLRLFPDLAFGTGNTGRGIAAMLHAVHGFRFDVSYARSDNGGIANINKTLKVILQYSSL